ncbi:MAG: IS200/IS605 family transposase [Lachnospiraceae bacterium]|nr:IS200/IS605 family transposase [Lachnospiraceae bacterium]
MSFIQLNYHIVFATKRREPTIDIDSERRVYLLLFSIMKKYGATVHRIDGMPDHIHICTAIPSTIAVSDFIKYVKRESSLAIKQHSILTNWRGWQEGSGCFSYSKNEVENIINYIKRQKEHHRKRTFIEEYRAWLIENGVSPDEPYFPK